MKLISSSPLTNNHSLSSHLALFISHLLQKYVNRERGVTKLPYQISDNAKAYTHTNTVVVTLNTNIWNLLSACSTETLVPELTTPSHKSILTYRDAKVLSNFFLAWIFRLSHDNSQLFEEKGNL